MTHDENVLYMKYIEKLKKNSIARTVKLADLWHNRDWFRLKKIDEKAIERVKKYKQLLSI